MEVVVSGAGGHLSIALVGQVDDSATAIVQAAAAVAQQDRIPLHVDTERAFPQTSPIIDAVRQVLRSVAVRQPVVVR